MKKLSFHYHLKITMDSPVCRHHFTLRCVPRSDTRQRILELHHFLSPGDWLSRGRDQWGNDLLYGCCGGQQSCFEANVCGLVETGLAAAVRGVAKEKTRSLPECSVGVPAASPVSASPHTFASKELCCPPQQP